MEPTLFLFVLLVLGILHFVSALCTPFVHCLPPKEESMAVGAIFLFWGIWRLYRSLHTPLESHVLEQEAPQYLLPTPKPVYFLSTQSGQYMAAMRMRRLTEGGRV